jgi:hypothetical protein
MRREGWIRERLMEDQIMLYFTTLVVLLIVVDALHAIGSAATR